MMKKLLLGCSLMMGIWQSAQQIDIKKDRVLVDNKEVAISGKDKKTFTLSTLDGNNTFSFVKEMTKLDNKSDVIIYEVANTKTGKNNTLVFDNAILGLNGEKVLVSNLMKKTKFFDINGLNVEKLNTFLNSPKIVAADVIKSKNDSISSRYKAAVHKFNEDQLQTSSWNIRDKKRPEKDNIVAYFSLNKVGPFDYTIEVYKYDAQKKPVKVGIWSNNAEVTNFEGKKQKLYNELITINGDEVLVFPDMFKGNEAKSISESDPAKRIAVFMHEFGYY